jgi:hypothetical protein
MKLSRTSQPPRYGASHRDQVHRLIALSPHVSSQLAAPDKFALLSHSRALVLSPEIHWKPWRSTS